MTSPERFYPVSCVHGNSGNGYGNYGNGYYGNGYGNGNGYDTINTTLK